MNSIEPQFKLLPPYLVKHHWPELSKIISRADDNTATVDDIEDALDIDPLAYDIWVYLNSDNKIVYVSVCQEVGRTYYVSRICKSLDVEHTTNVDPEIIAEYHKRAKHLGKDSLMFSGGAFWEKRLEKLGFTIKEYIYEAPVLDEPDQLLKEVQ